VQIRGHTINRGQVRPDLDVDWFLLGELYRHRHQSESPALKPKRPHQLARQGPKLRRAPIPRRRLRKREIHTKEITRPEDGLPVAVSKLNEAVRGRKRAKQPPERRTGRVRRNRRRLSLDRLRDGPRAVDQRIVETRQHVAGKYDVHQQPERELDRAENQHEQKGQPKTQRTELLKHEPLSWGSALRRRAAPH